MQPNITPQTIAEIQAALDISYALIEDLSKQVSEATFTTNISDKWSIGENLEHLILSTMGIASGLGRPKEFFMQFGTSERPTMSYAFLRENYFDKIRGRKAPSNYSPDENAPKSREELLQSWALIRGKITSRLVENWTEDDLDTFCLPHPALGKLTMREILFFAIFHNYHHYIPMQGIAQELES